MSKPLILVTGATGKTGAPLVAQLLQQGFPVRALVRKHDERSARLDALGAETVVGDFLDIQSIRAATQGANRIYFCYPPQGSQLVEATSIIAQAAREAGIDAIVNMSQLPVRADATSALTRQHWASENILDWANIGAIHIRPTYFAENLYMFGAQTIAAEGKLYLPYGAERHAPVAAADIGRVIVQLLSDPEPHVGQRYVLTGPDNLTIAEMAETFSEQLGKPVEYVDLPIDTWGDILGGIPATSESLVAHLKAVALDHQNGIFNVITDDVERITGQTPQSLAEYIRENRSLFQPTEQTAA